MSRVKSVSELAKLQTKFKTNIDKIDKNKLICIDETYIHSNFTTNYAWSKRGTLAIHNKKTNPKKYSIPFNTLFFSTISIFYTSCLKIFLMVGRVK